MPPGEEKLGRRKNNATEWKRVILEYLGAKCSYCGIEEKLDIHHVIPLYKGGKNVLSNLEVLCNSCHKFVHRTWSKFFPEKKKAFLAKCSQCERTVGTRERVLLRGRLCGFCRRKKYGKN